MKKVGILTLHYANNYGAALQCYALRKKINSFGGIKADVLNFIHPDHARYPAYADIEINAKSLIRAGKFDDFRKEWIGINSAPFSELTADIYGEYNYFIAGSDQIWNPRFTLRHFYFLDFAPDTAVKIAYAPSIAKPISDITDRDIKIFEKFIPRFDYLSVREKTHEQFIQRFTDKKVITAIDPTMLLSAADYSEITAPVSKGKYILLYFLNHDFSAPGILSFVNRVSIEYGLKVIHSFVEIPPQTFKNEAESFRFETGPKEFLGLIKNAEMVITNSFHGTIFSILFEKPFYSFVVKSMASRIYDLIAPVGLEDRIIEGYKLLSDVSLYLDFAEAREKMNALREHSADYLRKVLNIN